MLFGRRLRTDQEMHERLTNPIALAVFASDALVVGCLCDRRDARRAPAGGAGALAFGALMPLSLGIVALLVILVFSYRQTIKAYPSAGGAYIVTRDNFGAAPRAGRRRRVADRLHPHGRGERVRRRRRDVLRVPEAYPYRVIIAVVLIWVIALHEPARGQGVGAYLRGADVRLRRRHARSSSIVGLWPRRSWAISIRSTSHHATVAAGAGGSLWASSCCCTRSPSGSTAMTGVEAISNGVPAFKPVEWKNARKVLGVAGCAARDHVPRHLVPRLRRCNPIPSDEGDGHQPGRPAPIVGHGHVGRRRVLRDPGATMLILVLAANTSFADFPRLASFHADDHFLPTPLTSAAAGSCSRTASSCSRRSPPC